MSEQHQHPSQDPTDVERRRALRVFSVVAGADPPSHRLRFTSRGPSFCSLTATAA